MLPVSASRHTAPHLLARRVIHGTLLAVAIAAGSMGCSASSRPSAGQTLDVAPLVADVQAGRVRPGDHVRVTGIVTDDDPERQLAFIGDETRAIGVRTNAGGLGVARGQRVTLEARIEATAQGPHLADPFVLNTSTDALPPPALADAGDVFSGEFTGRRVELASRVQAGVLRNGRLHLTVTSLGVQFDAEVRQPEGLDWRSLIGVESRLRGIVAPADEVAGVPSPGRVIVASKADIERVGHHEQANGVASRELTTAASVHGLRSHEAAAGHAVKLRARVTVHDPAWTVLFVNDETAGIFVFTRSLQHAMPACRPGDIVEIEGETSPGEFAPVVAAHRLAVVGHVALPVPRVLPLERLVSGREDSQFVELTGIVRAMSRDDADHLALELVSAHERIPAFVPSISTQRIPPGLGVDAVVRVKAVVGTRFNAKRQMVGIQLFVPDVDQLFVESPAVADPFQLPLATVASLMNFDGLDRAGRLVHVSGVVVASNPEAIFLRDAAGTLEVRTAERASVRSGDVIDAVGFADTGSYSPRLVDAQARRTGQRALPEPVRANPRDLLRNGTDAALVRIEARVLQTISTATEDVLVLDADGQPFSAHLARSGDNTGGLRPVQNGSVVEIDGVSSLQVARDGNRLVPREIRVVLPAADAVRVVQTPPWFTTVHVLWALAALAAVTALSGGSIMMLRRRVARQTAQLRRAKEAAEAANRDRAAFLTRMSHDVRTPLNGVLGITDLLLEASRDAGQKQYLGMVKSSAESLLGVINDMLDLSKLEPGKVELHPAAFDLREMLGSVVQMLGVRAGEKKLRLTLTVEPDVPERIVADADRLRQVIVNLAGNAVKFTERGSVTITVGVAAPPVRAGDDAGCDLLFAVADTGIGISAGTQMLLFDAVDQKDEGAIPHSSSTGLGLPTSARIVSMMGGRIHVNSAPGRGSTFSFGIRVAAAAAEPALKPPAAGAPEPVSQTCNDTLPRLRVLVAEDNVVNQKLAEALLARRGQDAVIVSNGREAVDAWRRGSFDLIFMDVQMPVMDGFEATAAVRETERGTGRHVAIVAMTAHAMSGDRQRCLAAGMDDYISKPVSTREFDRVLREVAAVRAGERDLQTA